MHQEERKEHGKRSGLWKRVEFKMRKKRPGTQKRSQQKPLRLYHTTWGKLRSRRKTPRSTSRRNRFERDTPHCCYIPESNTKQLARKAEENRYHTRQAGFRRRHKRKRSLHDPDQKAFDVATTRSNFKLEGTPGNVVHLGPFPPKAGEIRVFLLPAGAREFFYHFPRAHSRFLGWNEMPRSTRLCYIRSISSSVYQKQK